MGTDARLLVTGFSSDNEAAAVAAAARLTLVGPTRLSVLGNHVRLDRNNRALFWSVETYSDSAGATIVEVSTGLRWKPDPLDHVGLTEFVSRAAAAFPDRKLSYTTDYVSFELRFGDGAFAAGVERGTIQPIDLADVSSAAAGEAPQTTNDPTRPWHAVGPDGELLHRRLPVAASVAHLQARVAGPLPVFCQVRNVGMYGMLEPGTWTCVEPLTSQAPGNPQRPESHEDPVEPEPGAGELADLYVCPSSGEIESLNDGGFDVCCDHAFCPGNRAVGARPNRVFLSESGAP